eukprot:6719116-Prymnesium_polylepis.1
MSAVATGVRPLCSPRPPNVVRPSLGSAIASHVGATRPKASRKRWPKRSNPMSSWSALCCSCCSGFTASSRMVRSRWRASPSACSYGEMVS